MKRTRPHSWMGLGLVSALLLARFSAASGKPDGGSETPAARTEAGAPSLRNRGSLQVSTPELVYLRELEPWPEEFAGDAAQSPADLERFKVTWAKVRVEVERQVSTSALAEISGWAKEQTGGITLSPGWSASIPMSPVGMSRDRSQILFAPNTEETGVRLPPYTRIVQRRLLVGAVFDRSTGSIPKVYITIRGWAEE